MSESILSELVARPVPIDQIWADVRQPRRGIPASIRLVWKGNPTDVPQLLQTWASVAANTSGRVIDIQAIINGEGEGIDTDGTPPIYESFISLLRLAGSILHEGLVNPISIVDQRERNLIESGERRWLAHWLIRLHTPAGDKFNRIPAVTASGKDFIWRQAAENTARRSLNAVSMARQLALLIMAARGEEQYHDYDQIVPAGGSDRRYYAQVADGNVHRIPKGSSERIQAAMALSMEQISRYRSIIRLTDDEEINDLMWLKGDIEDWPERAFRDVNTLPLGKVRELISRDGWSLDDFRSAASFNWPKVHPPQTFQPVGAHRDAPSVPPTTQGYRVPESVEARRILADIRQGFNRVYALEGSLNPDEQTAANNATRFLNQAQRDYENGRFAAAQVLLNTVFQLLDEAAAVPVAPRSEGEGAGGEGSPRMSDDDIQGLLRWAWRWGKNHFAEGGWFTGQDCAQTSMDDLSEMVEEEYLRRGVSAYNTHHYRITPDGCRFLGAGFEELHWDTVSLFTPPRSEEQEVGDESLSSDNDPSTPSQPPRFVVDRAGDLFKLLWGIEQLTEKTGHTAAKDTAAALITMTWEGAQQLSDDGQLADTLQLHYDNIVNALSSWSQSVTELLSDIQHNLAE